MSLRKLSIIASFLALSVGCSASTESTEVGVRTILASPIGARGVQPDTYAPGGTYFFFRPLSDFVTYDIAVQNLPMVNTSSDALRFKTIDGNDVWVEVTITWGINPDRVAYILQFVGGTMPEVETKLVRPVSRAVVRDVLNQLSSEEYYQSDRRFTAAERARERLNFVLQNEGLRVEQVLLGEHKFNQEYEQLIRDKKVAEQEAERLTSETEAEVEGKRRELQELLGQIEKNKQLAEGESAKRKRDSDAIRYEHEQQAAAIRIEANASAQGMRERAAAMSGTGGENIVKMRLAQALKGKKILFVPAGTGMDIRSTDMNALLQTYGIQAIGK